MKKIIAIFFITLLGLTTTFAEGNSLDYEMVSFTGNSQTADTPLVNLSFLNQRTFTINYQNFDNAFQFMFDLVIGISIATSVIVFMIAAFRKITNQGDVAGIKEGDEGMKRAIIGLMIVLSTWLIINTINPDLIRLPVFTNLDSVGARTQQQSSQPPLDAASLP